MNTRGRSMCRGDNDPPKEGEFVISPSIKVESGGLEVWCSGGKILMRRIRFVNFFIDLSSLVYFFRCGHVHASLVKIQGKEGGY